MATRHFNLPTFTADDKPSWLRDWNETVEILDTKLYELSVSVGDTQVIQELVDLVNANYNDILRLEREVETPLTGLLDRVTALENGGGSGGGFPTYQASRRDVKQVVEIHAPDDPTHVIGSFNLYYDNNAARYPKVFLKVDRRSWTNPNTGDVITYVEDLRWLIGLASPLIDNMRALSNGFSFSDTRAYSHDENYEAKPMILKSMGCQSPIRYEGPDYGYSSGSPYLDFRYDGVVATTNEVYENMPDESETDNICANVLYQKGVDIASSRNIAGNGSLYPNEYMPLMKNISFDLQNNFVIPSECTGDGYFSLYVSIQLKTLNIDNGYFAYNETTGKYGLLTDPNTEDAFFSSITDLTGLFGDIHFHAAELSDNYAVDAHPVDITLDHIIKDDTYDNTEYIAYIDENKYYEPFLFSEKA